jgi:hypothetical protein
MLGLTERPVIAPYAIAIEYADQHLPVLRFLWTRRFSPVSKDLVKVLRYSPLPEEDDEGGIPAGDHPPPPSA